MITIAICTYNGAGRLPRLVSELRKQHSSIPFEILIVDNNSDDNIEEVMGNLNHGDGGPLRYVFEKEQGIPFARNRAIEESLESEYLFFIDDDELPHSGWLENALHAFRQEGAQCLGGRIRCVFSPKQRPDWLGKELVAFLGEVDHGESRFWIETSETPIWSGNIAYHTSLFKAPYGYRFDSRYNRKGKGIGGGSDGILFKRFLDDGIKMRYCPDMVIDHFIEPWRLKRSYFIRLHFNSGRKFGQYQSGEYQNTVLGVPLFMMVQALNHFLKTIIFAIRKNPGIMRQAMNFSYAFGMIYGRFLGWNEKK